jgi:predicted Zn-dependent protease
MKDAGTKAQDAGTQAALKAPDDREKADTSPKGKVTAEDLDTKVPRLLAGILVVHSPDGDAEGLQKLAEHMAKYADDEVEATTGVRWKFSVGLPRPREDARTTSAGDFLAPAMTMLTEGKLDLVIVLTDVPVAAQDNAMVHGSYSRTARVAVMTTHRMLQDENADVKRTIRDKQVTLNATALFLHLLGHLMGVVHQWNRGDLMAPFRFDADRTEPHYSESQRARFRKKARKIPDQKVAAAGPLMSSIFHVVSAFRNAGEVLVPVIKLRALRIPLHMPAMVTAALVPVLVLVFTAEIWDVAFHMPDRTAYWFAGLTIFIGAFYVSIVHNLFFPRKERETLTEHAAVVNVVVWFCMLEALVGLFLVVGSFVWLVEVYVFPAGLMTKWTGLETPATLLDKLRLAVFISTLATMTAALAGGLDRNVMVRNMALFSDRA